MQARRSQALLVTETLFIMIPPAPSLKGAAKGTELLSCVRQWKVKRQQVLCDYLLCWFIYGQAKSRNICFKILRSLMF